MKILRRFLKLILVSVVCSLAGNIMIPAFADTITIDSIEVINRWDVRGNNRDEPYLIITSYNSDGTATVTKCIRPTYSEKPSDDGASAGAGSRVQFKRNFTHFASSVQVELWDADGEAYDCFQRGSDDFIGKFEILAGSGSGFEMIQASPRSNRTSTHRVNYIIQSTPCE